MPETIEGKLSAGKFRFAIVSSRVNSFVTNPMTEGAIDTLVRHGAAERSIDVIKVPGSFEVPLAVKKAALSGKYDAVVAIGAIIRGQTSHFDFLASQVTKDLSAVALETGVPVCCGIITTETTEQAIERAGVKAGNRGSEAALSALEMVNLAKALS